MLDQRNIFFDSTKRFVGTPKSLLIRSTEELSSLNVKLCLRNKLKVNGKVSNYRNHSQKWRSMGKYRTMLSYFLYVTKQHGHDREWEYLIFQRGLWGANIKQPLPTLLWPRALTYEYFLFECVDSTVAGLGYANIISCLVYSNLCEIKKYYLIKAYIL